MSEKTCSKCEETFPNQMLAVYGSRGDRVCKSCCGALDRENMESYGTSSGLPLYLRSGNRKSNLKEVFVENWCGTLRFAVHRHKTSRHNMAKSRIDVYFWGPDGSVWWGRCLTGIGGVVHCKRTTLGS